MCRSPATSSTAAGRSRFGDVATAELEPFTGATGQPTTLQDTVFSTIPGSPAYPGRATTFRRTASQHGMADVDESREERHPGQLPLLGLSAMTVLEKGPVRDHPRDPAPLLWAVTVGCWVAVVALLLTAGVDLADHDVVLEQSTLPAAAAARVHRRVDGDARRDDAADDRADGPDVRRGQRPPAAAGGRPRGLRGVVPLVWVGFALVALAGDTLVHGWCTTGPGWRSTSR